FPLKGFVRAAVSRSVSKVSALGGIVPFLKKAQAEKYCHGVSSTKLYAV
ncbi:hypothetical protein GNF11_27720, partial [Nostoc sp. UCD122]|nr:hypothetical protein [Nostoc sp. UCD122]